MKALSGKSVYLRALEPEDLEFVHAVENDEDIWEFSNTNTPYSRFVIRQYLENAQQDIFEARQLRLAICKKGKDQAVGLIDLFEFDPHHKRAGVGIVVRDSSNRNTGIGTEALDLLISYAFTKLGLHQLYANIAPDNEASVRLFTKFGFELVGLKKDWNLIEGQFRDEALYQLVNS